MTKIADIKRSMVQFNEDLPPVTEEELREICDKFGDNKALVLGASLTEL